ncbi:anthranilate synthase component I [Arthrobacter sp. Hiyo4]|nr:anthranilate synthase component I [Arthrobacter sp. Hiyo4]
MQALAYLPALGPALVPEFAARRGLRLRAERLDARPDAAALFENLYGGSANAVWLDSSNADAAGADITKADDPSTSAGSLAGSPREQSPAGPLPQPSPAAARSRFSILADDGGTFGQAVTHRSGQSVITAGSATARVPGPFFRWLDTVWGAGQSARRTATRATSRWAGWAAWAMSSSAKPAERT